jgi:sugar (pentulose or hexulose) kinase
MYKGCEMKSARIMAIDLGNSGGKCFVGTFAGDSFRLEEVNRFDNEGVPFFLTDRNGKMVERIYWDDTHLYRNIINGLLRYRREYSDHLDSIGIDTWGPDGQFITHDGEMVGKVYSYRDHRLDEMIDELTSRIDAYRIYEITGTQFQPFNISNQLLWFMLNRSYLLQPGYRFLPMPTIFSYYLGNVQKIDTTWASVTQLMDARTKNWSEEILQKLGIPSNILPEIVPPGTLLGKLSGPVAHLTGLNTANLYSVGSHDTASAFAAAPVEEETEALIISSGTWSLIGKLVPEPITTRQALEANISNEGGIENIRCLKNCMGLWIVQELRRTWREMDGKKLEWDEMIRLVENAPPFSSFIDPDNTLFYNQKNMEAAVAEYCKKTEQKIPKDRGTYLRVVYESLALKYRVVAEEIDHITGKKHKMVQIVGGGCRNETLNQFTADALDSTVCAGPADATAIGNIMVQAMGMGIIEKLPYAVPLIKQEFPLKTYTPKNSSLWNKAYKQFLSVIAKKGPGVKKM